MSAAKRLECQEIMGEYRVATMTTRAAGGLDEFLDVVRDRIAGCPVAGFDETGLRVAGRLHWVHYARTNKQILITCHPKRGRAGIDEAGVLGGFRSIAVHDVWAPCDTYLDAEYQLCWAHTLRELAGVAETAPPDTGWCWATQAADALIAMPQLVAEAIADGAGTIDADALARSGLPRPPRSDAVMKRHNALARRLIDRHNDYLRFTQDWRFPADNNGSEHDIRMIKLRQKVSGCLRTLTGARQFCAIRSYLSTVGKHFFDTLVMLAEGHSWLPAIQ